VTSGTSTTFVVGQYGSFVVHGSGSPAPTLTEVGTLPAGVSFADHNDGTALLSGMPAGGAGGSYRITLIASNGIGPSGSQVFLLEVDQAPAFVPGGSANFFVGEGGTFEVHATGYPVPSLSQEVGIPGVSFADNGDGTGVLAASPYLHAGVYSVVLDASNGVGPPVTITLQVNVTTPDPLEITSSRVDFCRTGMACSIGITATGTPLPTLSIGGELPPGLSFVDHHDGSATISGIPTGPGWFYSVDVTASNGVQPSKTRDLRIFVLPTGCSNGDDPDEC
jgi:hypothetical protein